MKKGTRADRRRKQKQRRTAAIVEMYGGLLTKPNKKAESYSRDWADRYSKELLFPPIPVISVTLHGTTGRGRSAQAQALEGFWNNWTQFCESVTDTPASSRVNPPGTIDLVRREDGVYD